MRLVNARFLATKCARLLYVLVLSAALSTLLFLLSPRDSVLSYLTNPSSPRRLSPLPSLPYLRSRLLARMVMANSGIHGTICEKLRQQQPKVPLAKDRLRMLQNMSSQPEAVPETPSGGRGRGGGVGGGGEGEEGGGGREGRGGGEGEEGGGEGGGMGCQNWRLKRGFERWPVTPEELQFPLAFSFKIHLDPDTFARLLSVVWRPHNVYCVHVDSKAPREVYQRVVSMARCLPNVLLPENRQNVVYSSVTSLRADLECARVAVQSQVPWKYHVNLCGSEFPLKTNLEMVQIFRALGGSNDVENYPPGQKFQKDSFKFRQKIVQGRMRKTRELKPRWEGNLFKGSAYNCLSRPFLDWAMNEQVHKDLLQWLNDTWAPDEIFWATLSNKKEAPGGPRMTLTHEQGQPISKAVNWFWDKQPCHGKYVHDICVFSSGDLPWLLSRHELIANKFNTSLDGPVMDCLERELERRAVEGYLEWLRSISKNPEFDELLQEVSRHVGRDFSPSGGGGGGGSGVVLPGDAIVADVLLGDLPCPC